MLWSGLRRRAAKLISDRLLEVKTDAQGHFTFGTLRPHQYQIRAERPGFMQPGELPNSHRGPETLDLRAKNREPSRRITPRPICAVEVVTKVDDEGTLRAPATMRLTPYGVIKGKVTAPNG